MTARIAHDYDQNFAQNKMLVDLFNDKKIIVITHIGFSCGEDLYDVSVYDVSVRSACSSGFKDGIIEVKE